jgi:hypothetical protein
VTETPHPPRRTGEWPVTHPVELDAIERQAAAEQQAEQEHGERYARYWRAVAWNELVFDNTQINTAFKGNR